MIGIPCVQEVIYGTWGAVIALDLPYTPEIVKELKALIPARHRAWISRRRLWLIHRRERDSLVTFLRQKFEAMCETNLLPSGFLPAGPRSRNWPGAKRIGEVGAEWCRKGRHQDYQYDYGPDEESMFGRGRR